MRNLDDASANADDASALADGVFFSVLKGPVDFLLVRHGESDGNAAGIFQGRQDSPLSPIGRNQAAARGRALAEVLGDGSAVVFCSPLSRARESAEIIARTAGIAEPRVEADLIELDTGSWTGRSWTEIQATEPDTWKRFHGESWAAISDAESPEALYRRAMRAWTVLRDAAVAEGFRTVVAVSHGGFLQWLIRTTFGCRSWFPLVPTHNCAASRLRVEPADGGAYVSWKALDEKAEVGR